MILDDQLAELWAAGASLTDIGVKLGEFRSGIAGRIARARARGDSRFAPRPVAPRKVRVIKPPGESVGNRHRQVAAEPAPRPVTLVELRPGRCKFPVSDPPLGHGSGMLFCAAPVTQLSANYCSRHAEIATRVSSSPSLPFSPRAPSPPR